MQAEDLKYNIEKIKNMLVLIYQNDNGKKVRIIAVVKLNAYGLRIIEYTKF